MSTPQNLDIFDYVVIGGGTAGLVVASRLVEDPLIRVCVLEAGSDVSEELDIKVPGFGYKNYEKPDMNWGFGTEAQRHAAGRVIPLPRGKALGGSSMINLMALGRGHATEYDGQLQLYPPAEYFFKVKLSI